LTPDTPPATDFEQRSVDDRDLLRALIDCLPDNIYVKDVTGHYLADNITHAHFVGLRGTSEIVNKTVYDLFDKKLADRYSADDHTVISSGQAMLGREEPIVGADGKERWISTSKIPLRDGSGAVVALVCISSDITRRKLAEDKLREQNIELQQMAESERAANDALRSAQAQMIQIEKLASLGQLVAGVAHEINNPLAFVTNNIAVLQRDYVDILELLRLYGSTEEAVARSDPDALAMIRRKAEEMDAPYVTENTAEILSRSRDGLKRIRQIVDDLREFARQNTVGSREPAANLNSGIESTINIVRGRAKKSQVELITDLSPLPGVTCDPAKINQVLLNLIVNATDACENGGTVTVRSRATGEHVEIEVTDTGCGIPMEIRDKIFEPFFTTKPQGQGTGLGLSISHGIVTDHGGSIDLKSVVGQGTTFTVRLPLVNSARK